ncbi:hypothetical protein L202_02112 [Cryptococcus amylolentus CBS 6039]|uniref:SP-RING-type domain-containing protein n=2 Tax=Cryptococcus amylolentus TaxID=104669 RepID=A0A1E3HZP5_9TREE|nr:hypothetical protein L202_02112 [Cryptococcus amylolentus CBS 6039]ODN81718.1 hypothetical protein L202_02112 [Cryptococcus amylolentus CBS 6039]ODO10081.1 hypothetical protein I350_02307 [Cryptococcus amylolentus CBS 6273]
MPPTYASTNINTIRNANGHGSYSAGPSNGAHEDIDMEDDEAPVGDLSDDEEGEEEDEAGWTEEMFTDKPIARAGASVVRGLSDAMRDAIKRLDDVIDSIKETAYILEEAVPDDPALKNVEASLFKAFDQRAVLKIKANALDELSKSLLEGREHTNIQADFENLSEPRIQEYMGKSQHAKFKKDREYADFKSELWSRSHETACPPISTFLTKGPNDEDDSDDDIDMGGQTQNYRCPITLTLYQDAVTSVKCNHTYSKEAIINLITNSQKNRSVARCPVTGCSIAISKADLKDNPAIQKRANDFSRRQQEKEDDRDDDAASVEDDSDGE